MKARDILGKRIVGVQESFGQMATGRRKLLDALVLDNGVRLIPQVHESDDDYGVTLVVNKTDKKRKPRRNLEATNEIQMFMHCGRCLSELPKGKSPREWAQLEVGWTKLGLQVWCKRHEMNVCHIDFEGQKHPANTGAIQKGKV